MSARIKSGARAVADVAGGRLLASVEIAAPIERVFRALSSAEVTEWWGSKDLYRTTSWVGDLRPGGHWRSEGVAADGTPFSVEGTYLEIDAPRKLVQTWKAAWDGGNETTITYLLESIESGTRLTLRHEGFALRADSCRGHAEGWERVLGWLAAFATKEPPPRYVMCRLVPPRATFPGDMTAEEAALMGKHAAYCRELVDEGVGVVFGPVGDPNGSWGLGVLRGANQAAVQARLDADPIILSGRGFRYETLPILSAITRP
jgi:uncharacterized protein YndB with AHSA1/START domain